MLPLYVQLLCQIGIDFVDLHVYPVNGDMLNRLITYTDQANACGKPVAISEARLQKQRDSEFAKIDAAFDNAIYARDTFSFWTESARGSAAGLRNGVVTPTGTAYRLLSPPRGTLAACGRNNIYNFVVD